MRRLETAWPLRVAFPAWRALALFSPTVDDYGLGLAEGCDGERANFEENRVTGGANSPVGESRSITHLEHAEDSTEGVESGKAS